MRRTELDRVDTADLNSCINTYNDAKLCAMAIASQPPVIGPVMGKLVALTKFLECKLNEIIVGENANAIDISDKLVLVDVSDYLFQALYSDPRAHTKPFPRYVVHWSVSMLLWLNIGRCSILIENLYMFHESVEIHDTGQNGNGIPLICALREWPTNELIRVLNGKIPKPDRLLSSISDSPFMVACGVARSEVRIMALKLTEFCDQIRTLHSAWTDRMQYHDDVPDFLGILEKKAFLLSCLVWSSAVMDISYDKVGNGIMLGGEESTSVELRGMTREVVKNEDRLVASHRFIFEMHVFFMKTKLAVKAHIMFEHVPISDIGIPGWTEVVASNHTAIKSAAQYDKHRAELRGSCWAKFLRELRPNKWLNTLKDDASRETLSKLYRVVRSRPCELEMYAKANRCTIEQSDYTQAWYEFRPSEAVKHSSIIFSEAYIMGSASALITVPGPRSYPKHFGGSGVSVTAGGTAADLPEVKSRSHVACSQEKDVCDLKLAETMIGHYLRHSVSGSDVSDFNWISMTFIAQGDFALDPLVICRNCNNKYAKIVQLMNRYYVWTKLDGMHKSDVAVNYYINTYDIETSVYVWLFIIHKKHNGEINDKYSISELGKVIFDEMPSKHSTTGNKHKAEMVLIDETNGGSIRSANCILVMPIN